MLEINNLSVKYETSKGSVNALGPINLNIQSGETCAFIGPSGCGKSTMLNVLSGSFKHYNGEVKLFGEPINPVKHNIGFIPQNFGLMPWKTVKQNCLLALKIKHIAIDDKVTERINYIFEKLDIVSLLDRFPKELSGGQRQRVSIARIFIMNPSLLLMDEPFSSLDSITREEAQDLFIDIWNNFKTTTLLVTHSIEEALYMGNKLIIMSPCPGTIIEIINNPLFNTSDLRQQKKFIELANYIRSIIKKGWKI